MFSAQSDSASLSAMNGSVMDGIVPFKDRCFKNNDLDLDLTGMELLGEWNIDGRKLKTGTNYSSQHLLKDIEDINYLFRSLHTIDEPWTLSLQQSTQSLRNLVKLVSDRDSLLRALKENPQLFEQWSWHLRGECAIGFFVALCANETDTWINLLEQSLILMRDKENEYLCQIGARFQDLMTRAFQQHVSDRVFSDRRLKVLNSLLREYQHEHQHEQY